MKKRIVATFILVAFLVTGLFLGTNYKNATAASSKQVLTYINGAEPRYLDPALILRLMQQILLLMFLKA